MISRSIGAAPSIGHATFSDSIQIHRSPNAPLRINGCVSSDQSTAYPQKLSALIALKVNVDWRENVGKMHLLRKGEFPVALFSEGGGLRREG